jgi:hypothetical protein
LKTKWTIFLLLGNYNKISLLNRNDYLRKITLFKKQYLRDFNSFGRVVISYSCTYYLLLGNITLNSEISEWGRNIWISKSGLNIWIVLEPKKKWKWEMHPPTLFEAFKSLPTFCIFVSDLIQIVKWKRKPFLKTF